MHAHSKYCQMPPISDTINYSSISDNINYPSIQNDSHLFSLQQNGNFSALSIDQSIPAHQSIDNQTSKLNIAYAHFVMTKSAAKNIRSNNTVRLQQMVIEHKNSQGIEVQNYQEIAQERESDEDINISGEERNKICLRSAKSGKLMVTIVAKNNRSDNDNSTHTENIENNDEKNRKYCQLYNSNQEKKIVTRQQKQKKSRKAKKIQKSKIQKVNISSLLSKRARKNKIDSKIYSLTLENGGNKKQKQIKLHELLKPYPEKPVQLQKYQLPSKKAKKTQTIQPLQTANKKSKQRTLTHMLFNYLEHFAD